MEKTNNSGKLIAVILILLFVGINFYKTDKEGGPQEQKFTDQKKQEIEDRKLDEKIAPTHNVQKLKYAYTGRWEKNQVRVTAQAQDGSYNFNAPENTRNNLQATAAKTKKDDKKKDKKKTAKKKKDKKTKTAKQRSRRNLFDNRDASEVNPNYANYMYNRQQQQPQTPSDDDKPKETPKSAQELYQLVAQNNSIDQLVADYAAGNIDQTTFYSVIEMLFASQDDGLKKLAFQALQQTPSPASLMTYGRHINEQMSPDVKAFAETTLDVYNDPQHIRSLNVALNSNQSHMKMVAANMIRNIVTTILQSQESSGKNIVYKEEQIKQYKALLAQSLNVINRALQSGMGLEPPALASLTATRDTLVRFLS